MTPTCLICESAPVGGGSNMTCGPCARWIASRFHAARTELDFRWPGHRGPFDVLERAPWIGYS